jgi:hypothetical protein
LTPNNWSLFLWILLNLKLPENSLPQTARPCYNDNKLFALGNECTNGEVKKLELRREEES